MRIVNPQRRLALLASSLVVALVAAGAVAEAANPVKGGKYSGPVDGTMTPTTISFEVSKSGKVVKHVSPHPTFPLKCGSFMATKYVSKAAKVKGGKFKAKVSFVTDTGSQLPAGTVKGTFGSHKREAGTLTPIKAVGSACRKTFQYRTKTHK
jgi:hypothetical protein